MAGEPTVVLIPARLRSTRLPDKPLAEIGGVPMMVRTTPLLSFKGGSHRPR
jgi:3-deoxy-manno-octulosonate cytidylyltransferase (CMP-KDO synthetase)